MFQRKTKGFIGDADGLGRANGGSECCKATLTADRPGGVRRGSVEVEIVRRMIHFGDCNCSVPVWPVRRVPPSGGGRERGAGFGATMPPCDLTLYEQLRSLEQWKGEPELQEVE